MGAGSTSGTFPQAGLYNDATDGSYLHVIGLALWEGFQNTLGSNIVACQQQGTVTGSLTQQGNYVRLNLGAAFGQGRYINSVAGNPPNPIAGFGGGNSGLLATPGWPLFILPPGYTVWFVGQIANTYLGLTAWYLVMAD